VTRNDDDDDDNNNNGDDKENRKNSGKICPSATFSTKNRTLTDQGEKTILRGGRLATNRLLHGMAHITFTQGDHITRNANIHFEMWSHC
jgi:hypothetical protein